MKKIGINGFGRIGKAVLRTCLEQNRELEVVAINSTSGPEKHAHLFQYDSLYGVFPEPVAAQADSLQIGDRTIRFTAYSDPQDIPWEAMGVEIVLEASGHFLTTEKASRHFFGGAQKVVITAPDL